MKAIMNICGRIVVLDHGKKVAEGSQKKFPQTKVIEIYLGSDTCHAEVKI